MASSSARDGGRYRYRTEIRAGLLVGATGALLGAFVGGAPIAPAAADAGASVGALVWEDLNANGLHDADEPGIAGFTVRLGGTESDGTEVERAAKTDAEGRFAFDDLAPGTYRVVFDPNDLRSNATFTRSHQGSGDAIDSDADMWSGVTQVVTVDDSTQELSLNAGIVIDRAAAIVLDVSLLEVTDPDSDRRSTITYELEILNAGAVEAPYELTDELRFGAGIEVLEARVDNSDPGGIETRPNFDGASETTLVTGAVIPPGSTHSYSVSVDAVVPEALTEDAAECLISATNVGSGFMSVVELSTNGETLTDRACVDAPIRAPAATESESVASESSADIGGIGGVSIVAGAAVVFGGAAAVLLIRRRRTLRERMNRGDFTH